MQGFDPRRITDDEIAESIRLQFPSAGSLKLLRRSANVTFSDSHYIYRVPVTETALKFAVHETQITQMLPDDPEVDFPRMELSAEPIPIQRYRLIPGDSVKDKWVTFGFQDPESLTARPGGVVKTLTVPSDFASLLGKAIAILHSCNMNESLRSILEERGQDICAKHRKVFTRQARLGNITWDFSNEKVQFLEHLDRDCFVFCHGDLNLGNILIPANPDGKKIGIIDFGVSACSVREIDFGIFEMVALNHVNGGGFRDEVTESYERHSGHRLDRSLIDKFFRLRCAIRDFKIARARARGGGSSDEA